MRFNETFEPILTKLKEERKECQHIFRLYPCSRVKKCLKCGQLNNDLGRVIVYPKYRNEYQKIIRTQK